LTLRKWGSCRLDSSGSGKVPLAGPSEHGNEPSCFIKCEEFVV
jgi:hypothetical protein